MHIFTEVLLIFLRNFGIKSCKVFNAYSAVEVYSCSRCGLCLDKCPLLVSARIKDTQGVYFLQSVRNKKVTEDKAFDCLLCGRCQEFCPVGIGLNNIRISQRLDFVPGFQDYSYLEEIKQNEKAQVAYFAGCMTHLTPNIKIAMEKIFRKSGTDYVFLDKEGGICCGRPLMLSGEIMKAHKLIEKNHNLIKESEVKILVVSCPICLKSFKEDYKLNVEILHHSQYLLRLANEGKIKLNKTDVKAVYHDPCELGRGSGIYAEPRQLLSKTLALQRIREEKESSMCCGSSMGGFQVNPVQREAIRMDATVSLRKYQSDLLVTACPLCKKTFAKDSSVHVKDIAEVVASSII